MNYTRTGYKIKHHYKVTDAQFRERLFWNLLRYNRVVDEDGWDFYSTKLTVLLCWDRF